MWLNYFSVQFSEARGSCICIPSSAFAAFFLSAWSFGRIETERVPTTARLLGHVDPRGSTTTEPPTYDYLRIYPSAANSRGGENIRDPAESFCGCYCTTTSGQLKMSNPHSGSGRGLSIVFLL